MVERIFENGFLVKSKRGRDKGHIYVIISKSYVDCVKLVDGENKKFKNSKLKNIKHLQAFNRNIPSIKEKIDDNKKVFDEKIYNNLSKFKEMI